MGTEGKRPSSGCRHVWRWLPRLAFWLTDGGTRQEYANVECERCGAQTWAHGRAPWSA